MCKKTNPTSKCFSYASLVSGCNVASEKGGKSLMYSGAWLIQFSGDTDYTLYNVNNNLELFLI